MLHPRLSLLAIILSMADPGFCQDPGNLKLKDYHPVSIYKTTQVKIKKAKYPVIDFHSHDYPKSSEMNISMNRRSLTITGLYTAFPYRMKC
jgi:hypothetical protein